MLISKTAQPRSKGVADESDFIIHDGVVVFWDGRLRSVGSAVADGCSRVTVGCYTVVGFLALI